MPLSPYSPISTLVQRSMPARLNRVVTAARSACCVVVGALQLISCTTPPQPPSVDESTKRPVNARAAVALQACQGDLSRASLLVSEMARASAVAAALTPVQQCPSAAVARAADPVASQPVGNWVAIVPFAMGSASWNVEADEARLLVRRANDAAVVMIRGRTDAAADSLQQTVLARKRAQAAAQFLEQAGVPKDKLRLTWQGAGDPLAGQLPTERAQSRRVEIEFYTAAPVRLSLRGSAVNGKGALAESL
jgi:outer membrane protein OmpA-like peptidoglycan-associated protein